MTASEHPLRSTLLRLRRALPKGSTFGFELSQAGLFLKLLRVPRSNAGAGSRFLADVLAAADAAGCPVSLKADPTDEPGDPDTLTLVRWYARFGFEPRRATDDGVWMERAVSSPALTAADVWAAAEAARALRPPREDTQAWLEQARLSEGASPTWRRPGPRA